MFSLSGKTALVSGGAHGIGRAVAEVFAEAGAHVFLCDVDDEAGRLAQSEISAGGGLATYCHADVSDGAQVAAFAAAAEEATGRIDVACCNASYTAGPQHGALEAPDSEWDLNYRVGLMGTQYLTRAALPAMIRQGGGSIVIVSSVQALAGCGDSAPYSAIKAAQLGFMRSAACDYGPRNIRVNAICPGPVSVRYSPRPGTPGYETQVGRTLLGRVGRPREIGYAALYLASDEASFVTGAALPVDGGWTAT